MQPRSPSSLSPPVGSGDDGDGRRKSGGSPSRPPRSRGLGGTASSSPSTVESLRRNCLLIVIGALLVCCTFVSLAIGHYHHNHYADQILGPKLQQFLDDSPPSVRPIRKGATVMQAGAVKSKPDTYGSNLIHERAVFESMVQRTKRTTRQCDGLPAKERNTIKKRWTPASELAEPPPAGCKTDVPLLPELGVGKALEAWLAENPADQIRDYPTCYVPPPKSCNVTTYTLVIMSHTTERLPAFVDPVSEMIDGWPGLTEGEDRHE